MTDPIKRLRGGLKRSQLTARQIASGLDAPDCTRRRVLEVAEIDPTKLARILGNEDRQSPFAMIRTRDFTKRMLEGRDGQLSGIIALGRKHLDLPEEYVGTRDISETPIGQDFSLSTPKLRAIATEKELYRLLGGSESAGVELLLHPVLRLPIGSRLAYIQPDVIALAAKGRIHVATVRTFPVVDGSADPKQVSNAINESAVHVLALQHLAVKHGFPADRISTEVMLVLPTGTTLREPTALVLPTELALRRLRRLLSREAEAEQVLASLGDIGSFPAQPTKKTDEATKAEVAASAREVLAQIPLRFRDDCVSCPLFRTCRDELGAQGQTARLGTAVAESLGTFSTVSAAWAAANGDTDLPGVDGTLLAEIRRARQLQLRALPRGA
ncbi:hypothetical protein [Leifsonia aquatica]|uniref:hypothetical protein n=1 Tax=Leifsonia aquatica TaxID=144185 RepID=UPI00381C8DBA